MNTYWTSFFFLSTITPLTTYCQTESFPLCTCKHSLNTSWSIFKFYIKNLICNKLIMKIMRSSFIHRSFVHFTHQYHALRTCLTHKWMCWWINILHTNIMHWKHLWQMGNVLTYEHFTCQYHVLNTCLTHG